MAEERDDDQVELDVGDAEETEVEFEAPEAGEQTQSFGASDADEEDSICVKLVTGFISPDPQVKNEPV